MASTSPKLRLTSFSHGAGCACKLGLLDLAEVLKNVPGANDPRVLVDAATRDDAAVYQISPDRALIATVDFFTPIVDDAATWGAIAATNALSDVYAMGGMPLFALNLVGWPRGKIPFELLGEVITGAGTAAAAAGCLVLGGHSVDSLEPHFGMAVIGEAHTDRLLTNAGARPGDVLVLTKPLGTGVLTTALKRDVIGESDLAEAVRSMTSLNDGAMRAALSAKAHAATDVTGFGLLGHLGHVVRASGVAAEIGFEQLPLLEANEFLPDLDAIDEGTWSRTAIFWINYPNNPTGAVAPLAFLEGLGSLAAEHDFLLAADEAYTELWFDEPPHSALEASDRSRVAVFQTLSKRSSMTGYRSGFVAGSTELISALRQYRPTVGTAPQEFVQRASVVAWNDEEHVERTREIYRRKRDVLLPALRGRGIRVAGSAATMYLWLEVPDGEGSEELAERLLEHGLIVSPGTFFGSSGEGYWRLALVPTEAECERAAEILERVL